MTHAKIGERAVGSVILKRKLADMLYQLVGPQFFVVQSRGNRFAPKPALVLLGVEERQTEGHIQSHHERSVSFQIVAVRPPKKGWCRHTETACH